MLTQSLLLLAGLVMQDDTGPTHHVDVDVPSAHTDTQDTIKILLKDASGTAREITATLSVPKDMDAVSKAEEAARAIEEDDENTNGNGNNPGPLVRSVSIGRTVSFVGQGGAEITSMAWKSRSKQKDMKHRVTQPKKASSASNAVFTRASNARLLFQIEGEPLGWTDDGLPSTISFGVELSDGPHYGFVTNARSKAEAILGIAQDLYQGGLKPIVDVVAGTIELRVPFSLIEEVAFGSDDSHCEVTYTFE